MKLGRLIPEPNGYGGTSFRCNRCGEVGLEMMVRGNTSGFGGPCPVGCAARARERQRVRVLVKRVEFVESVVAWWEARDWHAQEFTVQADHRTETCELIFRKFV